MHHSEKHMRNAAFAIAMELGLPAAATAQERDETRLTAVTPVLVEHFSERRNGRIWNEGAFQNPGLIVQADRKVAEISMSTDIRIGAMAGGYKNSFSRLSIAAGINIEIEQKLSDRFSFHAGTPVGAVTGYGPIRPAAMPYLGASAATGERDRLGFRAAWLPAKTGSALFGRSDRNSSDAIAGLFTFSREF
jgi:hypothetical protein